MNNPIARLFRSRDKPDTTNTASSQLAFNFGGSLAGKAVNPRTTQHTGIRREAEANLPW